MKKHPIIFNGEMVRAILDGRKTQTRRVIKNLDGVHNYIEENYSDQEYYKALASDEYGGYHPMRCPYGKPGDRLRVRETWGVAPCYNTFSSSEIPLSSPRHVDYRADDKKYQGVHVSKWRSSIHMPRWASRITLEIIVVRVERVQDITIDDMIAEGMWDYPPQHTLDSQEEIELRQQWWKLWDTINDRSGYGRKANPFVWVVEFRKVKQ